MRKKEEEKKEERKDRIEFENKGGVGGGIRFIHSCLVSPACHQMICFWISGTFSTTFGGSRCRCRQTLTFHQPGHTAHQLCSTGS